MTKSTQAVRPLAGLALLLLALSAACSSPPTETGGGQEKAVGTGSGLTVRNAHVRRWPGLGSGYLEILNGDSRPDRLLRVESPYADVELHETVLDGDVAKMRHHRDGFEIPAGGRLLLSQGGKHLMLLRLTVPQGGRSVPLTLYFERHSSVSVEAELDN